MGSKHTSANLITPRAYTTSALKYCSADSSASASAVNDDMGLPMNRPCIAKTLNTPARPISRTRAAAPHVARAPLSECTTILQSLMLQPCRGHGRSSNQLDCRSIVMSHSHPYFYLTQPQLLEKRYAILKLRLTLNGDKRNMHAQHRFLATGDACIRRDRQWATRDRGGSSVAEEP